MWVVQKKNIWRNNGWGKMDTCVYMAESLHYWPETTTTLLTGYTLIQNKKLKVWGKKGWNLKKETMVENFLNLTKEITLKFKMFNKPWTG